MGYELQKFDDIISNHLDEKKINKLDQLQFNQRIEQIQEECSRIKTRLMHIAFSDLEDPIVERHIQTYQSKLIILSNQITRKLKDNNFPLLKDIPPENKYRQLIVLLSDAIMELLTFIEDHFSNYFSENSAIPDAYFKQTKSFLEKQIKDFSQLGQIKNISVELTNIYMAPLLSFQNAPKGTTFKQLIYAKNYLKNIRSLLSSKLTGIKLEREIITTLIYLNLNSYNFYTYVASRITAHYQSKPTFPKQIATLQLFKKLIAQSQTKPDFAYIPEAESVKTQLTKWVTEEISYFAEQRQIEIQFQEPPVKELHSDTNEKLQAKLSVSQLAYSLKLLVRSNILTPESTGQMLEFITKHFSTPNQQNISKASLKNKYYSNDYTTVDEIQKTMKKLIELADRDKSVL